MPLLTHTDRGGSIKLGRVLAKSSRNLAAVLWKEDRPKYQAA